MVSEHNCCVVQDCKQLRLGSLTQIGRNYETQLNLDAIGRSKEGRLHSSRCSQMCRDRREEVSELLRSKITKSLFIAE